MAEEEAKKGIAGVVIQEEEEDWDKMVDDCSKDLDKKLNIAAAPGGTSATQTPVGGKEEVPKSMADMQKMMEEMFKGLGGPGMDGQQPGMNPFMQACSQMFSDTSSG